MKAPDEKDVMRQLGSSLASLVTSAALVASSAKSESEFNLEGWVSGVIGRLAASDLTARRQGRMLLHYSVRDSLRTPELAGYYTLETAAECEAQAAETAKEFIRGDAAARRALPIKLPDAVSVDDGWLECLFAIALLQAGMLHIIRAIIADISDYPYETNPHMTN